MVNKCCVVGCNSNYVGGETVPVFGFPKDEDLKNLWIRFVNRKDWVATNSSVICLKHFDNKFYKKGDSGKRYRLRHELKPIPTIYPISISSASLPIISEPRKAPTSRVYQEDEYQKFIDHDTIQNLESFTVADSPPGYLFTKFDECLIFHKITLNELKIPQVAECIRIDENLHVKLFYKNIPVSLPAWLRVTHQCKLKRRSMLENIPAHFNIKVEKLSSILNELNDHQIKKNQVYSSNIIHFSSMLRYTSFQSYKLLLNEFPLPSISLLGKLKEGKIDSMKFLKSLRENKSLSKDIIIIFDEMYLQKCAEYSGGDVIGINEEKECYRSVVSFMVVGLKENTSCIFKAVPITKLNSDFLKNEIHNIINSLIKNDFNVRAVVSDNHASNVSCFTKLINSYGEKTEGSFINILSQKIYLFFDTVHLMKNIRNNLLNKKRFVFPDFSYTSFDDEIIVNSGQISWKIFHDLFEKDNGLDANLRKAPKINNKVIHPGKFKQNVSVALGIFHETTTAAIKSYFPNRTDIASFLSLFNKWWIISNSKCQYSNNRLGNAAVLHDNKPEFFRAFADWLNKWENSKIPNFEKFTLSRQTSSALQRTLLCQASLIEDLLCENYKYVLTARFQSDPIEKRFGQYRQMSGGRFLVSLKDVIYSEQIIKIKSLVKAGIDLFENDLKVDQEENNASFVEQLNDIDFSCVILSDDSREVATYIAGFIAKKLFNRLGTCCEFFCIEYCEHDSSDDKYLNILSRGGLINPSSPLMEYICKSFAMLDHVSDIIFNSQLKHRRAAKLVLERDEYHFFLCSKHQSSVKQIIHTIVSNIYFNNTRKRISDSVIGDNIIEFKKRQREK